MVEFVAKEYLMNMDGWDNVSKAFYVVWTSGLAWCGSQQTS